MHGDLVKGKVGFSVREDGDPPSRPPDADFWLSKDKLMKLHNITSQLVPQPEASPKRKSVRASTSPFLQVNVDAIMKHQRGKLKKPPWWLGWLYSAVVTREEYDYD